MFTSERRTLAEKLHIDAIDNHKLNVVQSHNALLNDSAPMHILLNEPRERRLVRSE